MKTYRLLGLTAAVLFSIAAFEAHAQFFTLYFDESGNGSVDLRNGLGLQPDPGVMLPDPTQPGMVVLTYMLPVAGIPVQNGDIRVWEDTSMTLLSDVIRFTDANGSLVGMTADRMIYYSEMPGPNDPFELGGPELADTGFPTAFFPQDNGGIFEQGIEGNNGFQWAPGGAANNVYIGISDVPEPASFSLMILGGVIGLRRLLSRKQR